MRLAQNHGEAAEKEPRFEDLIGKSEQMRVVFDRIDRVAPTDVTVLIRGETGTGKELVARAIHRGGLRSEQRLICVNCAAIPETLIESELFGYEKGAFTGASTNRIGLIEAADGGTLFLDEIGELPLEAQARLLRFIQEGEIRAIGSVLSRRVDVRLIVATHRDLRHLCECGQFRADLYYRINVVQLDLPPLRERGEDKLLLAEWLLAAAAKRHGRKLPVLTPDAIREIEHHYWPGNVRELENAIERAIILGDGDSIRAEHLALTDDSPDMQSDSATRQSGLDHEVPEDHARQTLDEYFIRFVLQHQDSMSETEIAERLGVSRKCLWERRQRLGIPRQRNGGR